MEQFIGTPGVVVMSDVVQHEVLAHMVTESVKAKSKLKGALEEVREHLPTVLISSEVAQGVFRQCYSKLRRHSAHVRKQR